MFDFISSPITAITLSIMAPTIAFSCINIRFFTYRQCLQSAVLMLLLGLSVGMLLDYAFNVFELHKFDDVAYAYLHFTLSSGITAAIGCCFFLVLSERFFTETAKNKKFVVSVVLFAFAVLVSGFFSLVIINALLLLYCLLSLVDAKKRMDLPKELCFDDRPLRKKKDEPSSLKNKIKLERKPNIYIVLLESYCSPRALKRFTGYDEDQFESIVNEFGFTNYGEIFSNGQTTMATVYALFHGHLMSGRQSVSSESFVISTLRNNGYSFEYLDSSTYLLKRVFKDVLSDNDYTSFDFSKGTALWYTFLAPIFAQSKYTRSLIGGTDPFNTDIDFDTIVRKFRERLAIESSHPRMFFLRFGPNHQSNGQIMSQARRRSWLRNYRTAYVKTEIQIRQILTEIQRFDSDPLILLFGDHGMRLYDGLFNSELCGKKSPGEVLKNTKISLESLALDYFSVPLAIKWPCPHKTDGKILTHVNFFRYIFEALGAGDALANNLHPNISVNIFQPSIMVNNGTVLDMPIPYKRNISKFLANSDNYQGAWNHGFYQSSVFLSLAIAVDNAKWTEAELERIYDIFNKLVDYQGVAIEQATGYHEYCYLQLSHVASRLNQAGILLPDDLDARLKKMPFFIAHARQPNNLLVPIGDTRATSLEKEVLPEVENIISKKLEPDQESPSNYAVYESGYVFWRSSWKPETALNKEIYYSIRYGPARITHGHNDHMSITYFSRGQDIIIDPGFDGYNSDSFRRYFQSPAAHNVAYCREAKFNWDAQTYLEQYDVQTFWQSYFLRDEPHPNTIRTRKILFIQRPVEAICIVDSVRGRSVRTYEQFLHLHHSLSPEIINSDVVSVANDDFGLSLFQMWPNDGIRIAHGEVDPIAGWASSENFSKIPTPTIITTRTAKPATFLTVIVLSEKGENNAVSQHPLAKGVREIKISSGPHEVRVRLESGNIILVK